MGAAVVVNRVRGNDDPTSGAGWREEHIRQIEEGTAGSAFGVRCLLIRRQGQTSLDLREVKQIIILATHHIPEPHGIQVLGNGSVAIEPIQPHNGMIQRKIPRIAQRAALFCRESLPVRSTLQLWLVGNRQDLCIM